MEYFLKILRFTPKSSTDYTTYFVKVEKNGKFYRCIQYGRVKICDMDNIISGLKLDYPHSKGYRVSW